jgi:hypothetical protein
MKSIKIREKMINFTLLGFLSISQFSWSNDSSFYFPKKVLGREVLVADLHQHTVFSDGFVWPNIRIEEALKDGVDVVSFTEHVEYQPRKLDIPNPDKNRTYLIAKEYVESIGSDLIVINGAEITRDETPPGHINSIFLKDVNSLDSGDIEVQLEEARSQGAFIFFNHPSYLRQVPSGLASFTDSHLKYIEEGWVQGVEVGTDITVSIEAFELALEHGLTILANSDIHTLIDWKFEDVSNNLRPATLVLAKERTEESIKEALLNNKTIVIAGGSFFGERNHINPFLSSLVELEELGFYKDSNVFKVKLTNISSQNMIIENVSDRSMHLHHGPMTLASGGDVELWFKDVHRNSSFNIKETLINRSAI